MPRPDSVGAKRPDQPIGREHRVEARGSKEARQIAAPKLDERRHPRPHELGVHHRGIGVLRRVTEARRLPRQRLQVDPPKLAVGGRIARPSEAPADLVAALERGAIERVEALDEQGVPRLLEPSPSPRVRLVGLLDLDRPVGHRSVAGVDLERGLERGQLLRLAPRRDPDQPVEREMEQVAEPPPLSPLGSHRRSARATAHRVLAEQVARNS